ncbi:hypothetical protein RJ641_024255 [Dillenia turbinata]|uniref:Uncharacterized protein n=1 Tax=Dillenia turbinata TaxID=194707 RepID=A0AAN8UL13_9MAGN
MATTLSGFRPMIRASAASGQRRTDQNHRQVSPSNWWSPLFGWSSDPDYIDSSSAKTTTESPREKQLRRADLKTGSDPSKSRSCFVPGCFTEEKAKQLRRRTLETASFHDAMYHSAIASRLASDLPPRSDLHWVSRAVALDI